MTVPEWKTAKLRLVFKLNQYNSGQDDVVADEWQYAMSARYHNGPHDAYGT